MAKIIHITGLSEELVSKAPARSKREVIEQGLSSDMEYERAVLKTLAILRRSIREGRAALERLEGKDQSSPAPVEFPRLEA